MVNRAPPRDTQNDLAMCSSAEISERLQRFGHVIELAPEFSGVARQHARAGRYASDRVLP